MFYRLYLLFIFDPPFSYFILNQFFVFVCMNYLFVVGFLHAFISESTVCRADWKWAERGRTCDNGYQGLLFLFPLSILAAKTFFPTTICSVSDGIWGILLCVYVYMYNSSTCAYQYWYLSQQSGIVEALLCIAFDLFPGVYSNQCMSDP